MRRLPSTLLRGLMYIRTGASSWETCSVFFAGQEAIYSPKSWQINQNIPIIQAHLPPTTTSPDILNPRPQPLHR